MITTHLSLSRFIESSRIGLNCFSCSNFEGLNYGKGSAVCLSGAEKKTENQNIGREARLKRSGLGFGSVPVSTKNNSKQISKSLTKRKGKDNSSLDEREVDRVLNNIEKQELTQRKNVDRDVKRSEAVQGVVDYVRVENWSSTNSESDLEDLRMRSFSTSFSALDKSAPFHERLVSQLQLLDSKGELAVSQAGPPLPSFERWNFNAEDYLLYLVDQHLVYSSLENAIHSVVNSNLTPDTKTIESSSTSKQGISSSILVFSEKLGRSKPLSSDILSLKQKLQTSTSLLDSIEPSSHATAYAKYITWLAQQAIMDDKTDASLLDLDKTDQFTAQCRLFAHIFSLNVAHLTTGMRIGAKSVSLLKDVLVPDCISFYKDYPPMASNPLVVFVDSVNSCSEIFNDAEKVHSVFQELPRAVQKTSLLLTPLAVERR